MKLFFKLLCFIAFLSLVSCSSDKNFSITLGGKKISNIDYIYSKNYEKVFAGKKLFELITQHKLRNHFFQLKKNEPNEVDVSIMSKNFIFKEFFENERRYELIYENTKVSDKNRITKLKEFSFVLVKESPGVKNPFVVKVESQNKPVYYLAMVPMLNVVFNKEKRSYNDLYLVTNLVIDNKKEIEEIAELVKAIYGKEPIFTKDMVKYLQ
ncbi:MAG: hypothetical protein GY714_29275 [Desulfobacterales bacterium]|nr:hypothetical protein [Desulfobacterales bacterium]